MTGRARAPPNTLRSSRSPGEAGHHVELWWGPYALDESVVEGAATTLARARIPFAPNIHCFLGHADQYVDLTHGNCTGKRLDIEDYLDVERATVGASETAACRQAARRLWDDDPRFTGASPEQVMAVRKEILDLLRTTCRTVP